MNALRPGCHAEEGGLYSNWSLGMKAVKLMGWDSIGYLGMRQKVVGKEMRQFVPLFP